MPSSAPSELPRSARRALARLRAFAASKKALFNPRRLGALAALGLAGAVAVLLVDMLEGVAASDVASAVGATSGLALVAAAAASAGSYAALIGFERLALHQAGARVAPRLAALTGFISWSFTFVLGFGIVTGGAVRLRRYGRAGLTTGETLRVTLFGTVFFWLGIVGLAGLSLLGAPGTLLPLVGLPAPAGFALGLAITLALAVWIARDGRTLRLGGQSLTLPGARTGLAIVALGVADTGLAGLGLWWVLPADTALAFHLFLPIFAMATVAGVVSHAPGGIGAFEAVILLSVPGEPSALLGSLLVFRLVYYVAPFSLGALAFALAELAPQRRRLSAVPLMVLPVLRPLAPVLISLAAFAAGAVLVVSGALPAAPWRMNALSPPVPLPLVEAAHVAASLCGAALLVAAAGLKRQVRASHRAALVLLAAGAVFSLLRGFAIEAATICGALGVALVLARRQFDRAGSAFQTVTLRRLGAIAAIILAGIAAGFATHGDIEWHNTLDLAAGSDGPRAVRASLGAMAVLALLVAFRALRPAGPASADAPGTARLAAAVAHAADPNANLAFLGDKRFLFDGEGGFIMYQVQRGTHLAMGDPVASTRAGAADLIWRFRELAHANGGEPAFYQVSAGALPLYIEAGFTFIKLGEEAVVDLSLFSMTGSRASRYRQMVARAERAGLTFEIVPASAAEALLPTLKPISDDWLSRQIGREKGFSIGFWDEAYLARFDHAVVRAAGVPVAFATLWRCGEGPEAAIDLMRYGPDLPGGTMDYLFISLINALKERGVARLSLGMAPLSGLAEHHLAPAWSRVGATVYRCGGAFFNFSGLRDYKAKFKPDWRPRFLAHTGARSVARIMLDTTLIVSRGPRRQDTQASPLPSIPQAAPAPAPAPLTG